MSDKPILFSTEMVKAILENRKSQTRRVVKNKMFQQWIDAGMSDKAMKNPDNNWIDVCPYGQVGDILWVRETWAKLISNNEIIYKANKTEKRYLGLKWRPSIFMPRTAARLFLKVKDIRVERLQDITEEDAIAEGCKKLLMETRSARNNFMNLWNSINTKRGYIWAMNNWVWVVEFERVDQCS